MSRLFYDESPLKGLPKLGLQVREERSDALRYLEKVAKLVPSEIVAGYVTLVGLIQLVRKDSARPWLYLAVFLMCLVLTPIYLNVQAEKKKPKRNHLIVSTFAFIVWAYAVSGGTVVPSLHDPAIASISLISFSLVSGVIPLNR